MKFALGFVGVCIFAYMVCVSDYAQQDKYREGYRDCDRYHVMNGGKNCPQI